MKIKKAFYIISALFFEIHEVLLRQLKYLSNVLNAFLLT